jgi:putative nucleotidyltransferase with HDIG domain
MEAVHRGAQDYLIKGSTTGSMLFRVIRYAVERKSAEEELKNSLEKLTRALHGTIKAMAMAVAIRDPYTAGHQKRGANLARAIAEEMNLDPKIIEGIQLAGMIHDIGKISIPAEILSKPSLLSNLELSLIRIHPQVGYDILKEIDFPWPIAQTVLQHHERINGSGYPAGLKNGEILLEAKVLAVADVVEAIASHRPYRPAYETEEAMSEITEKQGILYEPIVVESCLKLFKDKKYSF